MADLTTDEIQEEVRRRYAGIARAGTPTIATGVAHAVGYSESDLAVVPEGANLGLGCGNPVALASLRAGEVVLDLGSGAGFDAFLAARAVGASGRVIGVDMTAEMVEKARANAATLGLANVEFRQGMIEQLPVDDASVDVIISNCVVNLVPDKARVFAEAHRVLQPAGRLMISDLVALGELPAAIRKSIAAYVGCIAGVSLKDDYVTLLHAAGFARVEVVQEKGAAELLGLSDVTSACACTDPVVSGIIGELLQSAPVEELLDAARLVVSAQFTARKK